MSLNDIVIFSVTLPVSLDVRSIDYVYELARYKECIVNRVSYLSQCNDCLVEEDSDLLNAAALLLGIEKSLEIRFIDQIIYLINALNRYCTNDCGVCGKFSSLATDQSQISDDYYLIQVDGGSLD
jgi:hypothetical protein